MSNLQLPNEPLPVISIGKIHWLSERVGFGRTTNGGLTPVAKCPQNGCFGIAKSHILLGPGTSNVHIMGLSSICGVCKIPVVFEPAVFSDEERLAEYVASDPTKRIKELEELLTAADAKNADLEERVTALSGKVGWRQVTPIRALEYIVAVLTLFDLLGFPVSGIIHGQPPPAVQHIDNSVTNNIDNSVTNNNYNTETNVYEAPTPQTESTTRPPQRSSPPGSTPTTPTTGPIHQTTTTEPPQQEQTDPSS